MDNDKCIQSPNGKHWFVAHIGDQNPSTYRSDVPGCVFCKRIDLDHLPSYEQSRTSTKI